MTSSSRLQTGWMPCMAASATSAGLVVGRWPPLLPASQVTTLPPWGQGRLPIEQAAGRRSDYDREGPGRGIWAADGQQPVSVTIGEPARKPWRIMAADPAIDGY